MLCSNDVEPLHLEMVEDGVENVEVCCEQGLRRLTREESGSAVLLVFDETGKVSSLSFSNLLDLAGGES